jgi:chemotaxis protein CheX
VDILVFSAKDCQRAQRFEDFVRARAQPLQRLAQGQRLPAGEHSWLGAVFFSADATLEHYRQAREEVRYLGIHLLVIGPPLRLPTAGAEPLFAHDIPDELILKILQVRPGTRPVPPALRAGLAAPLISAVRQTLTEMADLEVTVRSVYQRERPTALGDISVLLKTSSSFEGTLVFCLGQGTAAGLAARVLGPTSEELDSALIQDCAGEIANVVAGLAKTLLFGTPYHFIFSTPTVTDGLHGTNLDGSRESVAIAFDSAAGGFALQLCSKR